MIDYENPVTKRLVEELQKIPHYDHYFILGVLAYTEEIEDQQEILDFIDHGPSYGEEVTAETVTMLAIYLAEEREEQERYRQKPIENDIMVLDSFY